jgi:hypothetical protein
MIEIKQAQTPGLPKLTKAGFSATARRMSPRKTSAPASIFLNIHY